jgi:hypothetical protein
MREQIGFSLQALHTSYLDANVFADTHAVPTNPILTYTDNLTNLLYDYYVTQCLEDFG